MKAMILAAGRGERMRPLTDETPKPLLQVQGKALIEHHIERLIAAGVSDIVINVSYQAEQIQQALQPWCSRVNVHFSYETQRLETGGGIFQALPVLAPTVGANAFLIINGDVWTDYPLTTLVQYAQTFMAESAAERSGHLVMVPNPSHHVEGDFYYNDASSEAVQVLSNTRTSATSAAYTYSGLALLHSRLFQDCEAGAFPLGPLLRRAIDQQYVTAEIYRGAWTDVGTPERLRTVRDEG